MCSQAGNKETLLLASPPGEMAAGQACGPRSHKATQTGTGNWCHLGFDLLFQC